MDVIQNMTDDQAALIGCAGALLAAFTVMGISYHLGRFVRGDQPLAKTSLIRAPHPSGNAEAAPASRRKAA